MSALAFRIRCRARTERRSSIAMVLLVAVVGAVVLALVAGARRTASAPDRFESSYGARPDAEVVQFDGLPRTAEIAALPAVEHVDTATFMMASVVPASDDTFAFAGTADGIGGSLVIGRQPDPDRTDEFVATDTFVRTVGKSVGDTFRFISLDQQQADEFGFQVSDPRGPSFEATLVGIVSGFSDGDPTRPKDPIVVFPVALIERLPIPVRSSVMAVVLRDGATLDELRAQITSLPRPGEFDAGPAPLVSDDVRRAVSAQATALWMLAAAATIAAVASLGQIASRRARLSPMEHTSLAALGVNRRQIALESIAHGALPTVAGAALAGVIAPLLSGMFPTGLARGIDPTSGLRVDVPVNVLGALALAASFTMWIALSLALFARRGSSPSKVGLASRFATALPGAAFATGVRFAFSRSRRDRAIAPGSLVGVGAAVAAAMAALTFGASLDRLISEPDRFGDPFTARFGDAGSTVPSAQLQRAILDRPEVEGMSLITSGQALIGDDGIGVTAVEHVRGPLPLHALEGRLPDAADEVAFGRLTARDLGLSVGDDVEIIGPSGPATFRMIGLAPIPDIGGVDGVGRDALVTLDGMRRLDREAAGIGVGIILRPGWTVASVQRLADDVGVEEQLGQPSLPTPIANLDRIRVVPYLLAALLGALGALTMAHVLLVSARNRRKDIAVLGALGADRHWLSLVVHWQAVALIVLPLLLGVPTGIVIGSRLFRVLADQVGVVPDARVPTVATATVVAATFLLANIAALLPARRARRLDGSVLLQAA